MTDLLLRDARLHSESTPVDVLIRDGLVAEIGSSLRPEGAVSTTDLAGRWVLPGLWDHHVHFDQWSQLAQRLDVSAASSAVAAAELVRERLNMDRPGRDDVLVGYGFRDALWADAPSRELLDLVSGDRAVVLISGDLHCAWLNTPARVRFGVTDEATLVREADAMRLYDRLGAQSDAQADEWAGVASQAAARRGVVGIVDLEAPWSLDAWTRRVSQGNRSLRVSAGVWASRLDEAIERGLRTGDVVDGTDGLVRMGPLKIITDGSLNTRTAYCHDRYPGLADDANPHGLLTITPAELVEIMERADQAGIESAIHAIGDHANALVLQAFEDARASGSVEHAQLLDRADVARFAELGVLASVQPEHAMDDRDVADRYWNGRTDRAFLLRSLLQAGAVLTLGSDAPVAPLDPWVTMAAAVSHSRDGRTPWHPEQEITFGEALAASTAGDVVPGVEADLVVLDRDPWTADAPSLRQMPVTATILAGRFTHNNGLPDGR